MRDYLWADTDEQQADVLRVAFARLGLDLSEDEVLPPRVRMMTMHRAKGLGAEVVFVPGLEEAIFPGEFRRPYPGLHSQLRRHTNEIRPVHTDDAIPIRELARRSVRVPDQRWPLSRRGASGHR